MFRIFRLIALFYCVSVPLYSQELLDADDTLKSVLTTLNSKPDSSFVYSSPEVTNHFWKNDSTGLSVAHLELRLNKCDGDSSCIEQHVMCELRNEGSATEVVYCSEKERAPHFTSQAEYSQENSDQLETKPKTSSEKLFGNESSYSFADSSVRTQVGSHPDELFTADDFEIEKYLESLIEFDDKPEGNEKLTEKVIDSHTDELRATESSVGFNAAERSPVEEEPVVAKKAFCLGCPVDLNVNNPDLLQFIDQALDSIDGSSTNSYKHGLVKLHRAQRQVVNGIIYMLLLDVGETTCSKESNTDRNLCSLNLKIDPSTCYIEIFETPGLEKERRVVYNNCTEVDSRYATNEITGSVSDASIFNTENVPPNSDTEGRVQSGMLDNVAKASAEENIYNYAGDYVQKTDMFPFLWLDIESYLSNPAVYYYDNEKQNIRMKRNEHSAFIGTLKEIGPEEKQLVDELAAVAMETLDSIDEDNLKRVIVEIVDAKKQIMSGVMYYLKLIVGTTSCDENWPMKSDCLQEFVLPLSVCVIQLHRSFIDNSPRVQVVKSECAPKEEEQTAESFNSRNIEGSLSSDSDIDASNQQIMMVTNYVLPKISIMLNASQTLIGSVNIHTEVRDDIKTYVSLKIAPCIAKNVEGSGCVANYSETKSCNAEISQQLTGTPMQLLNFSCVAIVDPKKQDGETIVKQEVILAVFRDFMAKYNKTYKSNEEMQQRFSIFKNNLLKIEQLQRTEQGTGKYGTTQFADLTAKEFIQKYLGLNPALKRNNEIPMAQAKIPDVELPVEFDWRHYNVVTPIKNQGACGSCWAFSVTGNVEGQWAIHKGELLSLSEQELVDCDTLDSGCEGGLPDNAYRAIEKLGGLETENDYPYEGENENCHFNRSEVKVRIQGAVNITTNETKMAQWLVKNGPISIGINANAMQFYVGGVSHPWKFLCDPSDLDHGVLIVGYGVHKTYFRHKILPYWIVKNSWGTFWGEKGYYRVYRGDGTCGVNMMASSAIVY